MQLGLTRWCLDSEGDFCVWVVLYIYSNGHRSVPHTYIYCSQVK